MVERGILDALVPLLHEESRKALYQEAMRALLTASQTAQPDYNRLVGLSEALTALGGVKREEADRVEERLLSNFSQMLDPPCWTLSVILHANNPGTLVEILKWPTCGESERQALVKAVWKRYDPTAAATAMRRPRTLSSQFAWWARAKGLDVVRPSRMNPRFVDEQQQYVGR
jgi:hypothetical protein